MRYRAVATLALVAGLAAPWLLPAYALSLLSYTGLAALVAIGLVLLTGIAGQSSFGQAAFVGISAYTTAYLSRDLGLSPFLGLPAGLLLTGIAAWLLGLITVRLSGHYLPLGTVAWGISLYSFFVVAGFLGGFNGMAEIPGLSLFGHRLSDGHAWLYLIWVVVLASLWLAHNLLDSRHGRAIRALNGGRLMAESMGIDTDRVSRAVFVLAALYAGVSGWLFAHFQRFVNPTPFSLTAGIEYLFMVIVGGAGWLWGAVLGAGVVTVLRDQLNDLLPRLIGKPGNYETVVFAAAVILMLQRAPQGLWPVLRRIAPAPPRPHPIADDVAPVCAPLPPADTPVLALDCVTRRFGGLVANNAISFTVATAEIVALIGPNGAGKSTLFDLVSGVLPPDAGTISLFGEATEGLAARAIARRGRRADVPARAAARGSERARQCRPRHARTRPRGHAEGDAAPGTRRGGAAARRGGAADPPRRPRRAHGRCCGCAAPRPAAHRRDRARALPPPAPAAAGRARRRIAPPGEAPSRRADPEPARGGHDHSPGRARHGVRDGPRRSRGGDGFRPEDRRGPAGPRAARSRRARSLSRRHRVSGALLAVADMHAGYGRGEVLHGITLRIGAREIVAIVGPNGAGKTTLMSAIMRLLPARGEIMLGGAPAPATTEALVAAGVVLVPETRALFADMSVDDNLRLGAFQRYRAGERDFGADFARVLGIFPRLAERRGQVAGTLSGGERQMLALGRALMGRPKLLLLDEPSLGLAPRVVREIFHVLGELRADGLAILLVEQNARAALQLSDFAYVLEMGEMVLQGPSAALATNPRVLDTYLGTRRDTK